jgi:hypothetical protein
MRQHNLGALGAHEEIDTSDGRHLEVPGRQRSITPADPVWDACRPNRPPLLG